MNQLDRKQPDEKQPDVNQPDQNQPHRNQSDANRQGSCAPGTATLSTSESGDEIVICEDRTKARRQIYTVVFMLLISVWITIGGISSRDAFYAVPGILGTLLFGASLVFIARGLIRSRPLLTINSDGIIDSSTMTSIGFVSWEEIESVTLAKRYNQTFLDVRLRDDDAVLERLSKRRRLLLKLNFERYLERRPTDEDRALVSVPLGTAALAPEQVRHLLEPVLKQHGRKLMF